MTHLFENLLILIIKSFNKLNICHFQITRKAADILRSTKFSGEDAKRAKGILKGDLAAADEDGDSLLDYLGFQSLFTGKPLSLTEQFALVDSVTADDMNAVSLGRNYRQ